MVFHNVCESRDVNLGKPATEYVQKYVRETDLRCAAERGDAQRLLIVLG